jgi:hypothetical protein
LPLAGSALTVALPSVEALHQGHLCLQTQQLDLRRT